MICEQSQFVTTLSTEQCQNTAAFLQAITDAREQGQTAVVVNGILCGIADDGRLIAVIPASFLTTSANVPGEVHAEFTRAMTSGQTGNAGSAVGSPFEFDHPGGPADVIVAELSAPGHPLLRTPPAAPDRTVYDLADVRIGDGSQAAYLQSSELPQSGPGELLTRPGSAEPTVPAESVRHPGTGEPMTAVESVLQPDGSSVATLNSPEAPSDPVTAAAPEDGPSVTETAQDAPAATTGSQESQEAPSDPVAAAAPEDGPSVTETAQDAPAATTGTPAAALRPQPQRPDVRNPNGSSDRWWEQPRPSGQ